VVAVPKRATVYLDLKIHQAVKMKAAQNDTSISDIVNEALKLSLREDAIDLQAIWDRKRESTRSYESIIRDLKRNGRI
jgi:phosphate uptake regulator